MLAAKPIRAFYAVLIWLLYLGGLRRRLNTLQRRLQKEGQEARISLQPFRSVDELRRHLKPFQYRKDKARWGLPLDYVSDPRVFEARLNSGSLRDGDCDDFHHYVATQLERMGLEAYHVTIGYQGGGHVACVYASVDGTPFLWNYQTITKLDSWTDAGTKLLAWADRGRKADGKKGPAKQRWLVFETTKLERVKLK